MNSRLIALLVVGVLALVIAGVCILVLSRPKEACGKFERKGRQFQFWASADLKNATVFEVKIANSVNFFRLDTEALLEASRTVGACDAPLLAKLTQRPAVQVVCEGKTLSTRVEFVDVEGKMILSEFGKIYGLDNGQCRANEEIVARWDRSEGETVHLHIPAGDLPVSAIFVKADQVEGTTVADEAMTAVIESLKNTKSHDKVVKMDKQFWDSDLIQAIEQVGNRRCSKSIPVTGLVKSMSDVLEYVLSEENKKEVKALAKFQCQYCAKFRSAQTWFYIWQTRQSVKESIKVLQEGKDGYFSPASFELVDGRNTLKIANKFSLHLTNAGFEKTASLKTSLTNLAIAECPDLLKKIQRIQDAREKITKRELKCGATQLKGLETIAVNEADPALILIGEQGYKIAGNQIG